MKLLISAVLLVSIAWAVEGLSDGAPVQACDTLAPAVAGHLNAQPQTGANPYSVDLSAFDDGNGGFEYTLGATYTLSVSGVNQTFRGFFVQARQMSNDANRVGEFTVLDTTRSRLSSCLIPTDGITHSSSVDKTTISFNWTAPMEETGDIRFGFAVVQVRVTYWANDRTMAIAQVGATAGPTAAATSITNLGVWTLLVTAIVAALKVIL